MLDFNPIEELSRVRAMRYGKVLVASTLSLSVVAVVIGSLWGIHRAFQTGSGEGIEFVAQVLSWECSRDVAFWGAILLVGLWGGVVWCSVIAKRAGHALVLTVTDWGIGIAGHRGYPDNPADPDLLCLWVAVSPAGRPPETLDILVGCDPIPIPAIDWHRKVAVAFTVHFGVSRWRHKGEQQVELVAKEGGGTHSAGRIIIDFNMEPFGRHSI